jgi:(p)ppGpp synthase/HD superfamily hydrolase
MARVDIYKPNQSFDAQLTALGLTPEKNQPTITLVNSLREKVLETYTPLSVPLIMGGLLLMIDLHKGQKPRSDGTPYMHHLLTVGNDVLEGLKNPDPDIANAALLHDSCEDQLAGLASRYRSEHPGQEISDASAALGYIEDHFGQRVRNIIYSVSNPNFEAELLALGIDQNHPEYIPRRNDLYAQHVAMIARSPDPFIVKLSDFAHNTSDFETLPDSPKKDRQLRKYQPVIDIMLAALLRTDAPLTGQFKAAKFAQLMHAKNYLVVNQIV